MANPNHDLLTKVVCDKAQETLLRGWAGGGLYEEDMEDPRPDPNDILNHADFVCDFVSLESEYLCRIRFSIDGVVHELRQTAAIEAFKDVDQLISHMRGRMFMEARKRIKQYYGYL